MKELKITSIFASVILSCVLIGCDFSVDEDDENDNNNNNGGTDYEYDFQNQDLQGEIEGEVWVYRAGTAEISFFDNTKLSIDIYDVEPEGGDACEFGVFSLGSDVVLFSVPNEVGLYELGSPHTVTLFESDTYMNYIATDGAVEILTIDSTAVTGRMDVAYDSDNHMNGNFTLTFCSDW